MEAKSAESLPVGEGWYYEPKWDGFRCLLFRDRNEVELQSKNSKPLARYFPELVAQAHKIPLSKFVLDGELVVPHERRLDFEQLQLRLHPAASRVRALAESTPASYIAFDLLALDKHGFQIERFDIRRKSLEELFAGPLKNSQWKISPAVLDHSIAQQWLNAAGRSLDGVVAKQADSIYCSGERKGMIKVKNLRSVDCVVGGYRVDSSGTGVGSLLLGLFNSENQLDHVGFVSGLPQTRRRELLSQLREIGEGPGFTGRSPGGPSRWDPERCGEYIPLPHLVVVEVTYDHASGGRFRHGAHLQRFRPDKDPEECLNTQIIQKADPAFNLLEA